MIDKQLFKNNYHTHTLYCGHATGHVEDYVEVAIKNDLQILGFSEHGKLPFAFFTFTNNDYVDEYIAECHEAKIKYRDKIKIYCGLEMDYFPLFNDYYHSLLKTYDYLTLSCHYYILGNASDWRNYNAYRINDEKIIKKYKDIIIEGIRSKLFLYCNHPDNFLSSWNEISEKASNEIIDEALKNDFPLELNINQFFYSDLFKENMARYKFWELAGLKQVKVIINSDAHHPDGLNYKSLSKDLNTLYEFIKKLNLNIVSEVKIKDDY